LFNYSPIILAKPTRTGQNESLTTVIKKRTANYHAQPIINSSSSSRGTRSHCKYTDDHLAKSVTAKVEDGNIRAALRILLSDDKPAEDNDATYNQLLERHPQADANRKTPPNPNLLGNCLQVTEVEVKKAIRSFPPGSSGGPDGLRPQHVADLVSCVDSGPALLTAITGFVNTLLRGQCAAEVIPILFGAKLTALMKKSGGIRPIAVGYYWRRLVAKCANFYASSKLATYFAPIQLGVGVPGGAEAAVHACRRYIEAMPDNYVVVKLDFSNAFNCIHRDAMLEAIYQQVPEIYAYCHLAYSETTMLKYNNRSISSDEGIQQGDPLGPTLFCLTIHPMLQSLSSELRVGYMDDITLGGPEDVVAQDVSQIKNEGNSFGVHLNITKCECISKFATTSVEPLAEFIQLDTSKATLLGAPLSVGSAMDTTLQKRLLELNRATGRLRLISAHDSLVLLRASCGAPKLLHSLRASPCANHNTLPDIDSALRSCLSYISNVNITNLQWQQASLPVKNGGLGIRSVVSVATPAFLASVSSTKQLQDRLLSRCLLDIPDHHFDTIFANWRAIHQLVQPPAGVSANKQKAWDKPCIDKTYSTLLASQVDDQSRARLLAASAPHSGDWLQALPISSCGLRLDDESVRVAHGLSCKKSSARTARHSYLNDVIHRALVRAKVASVKEPVGLLRTDGKRPDGLTLVPWQAGKNAVWDVTVADTLATSYVASTSVTAGSAAELAASRKEDKYTELSTTHNFVPLAFETMGPMCSKALVFLGELGRRLTIATDDPRETMFLFQRAVHYWVSLIGSF
jgi:hypothetical protein